MRWPGEPVDEADRVAHAEPAVDLDHQADVAADRAGHGLDDGDGMVLLVRVELLPGGAERVELQRPVAAGRRPRGRARRSRAGVSQPPYQPLA